MANPWHIAVLALAVATAGQLVLIVCLFQYCRVLMRRTLDGPASRTQVPASPRAASPRDTERPWRLALPQAPAGPETGECATCTGLCCRYINVPLTTPTTPEDYDWIRYLLAHEGVLVFVDEEGWHLEVGSACTHLTPDYRCGIYPQRPQTCREYSTEGCDQTARTFADFDWKHHWRSADVFERWLEDELGERWRAYGLEQQVWNTVDVADQEAGQSHPVRRQRRDPVHEFNGQAQK